jgi:hypothetical protein
MKMSADNRNIKGGGGIPHASGDLRNQLILRGGQNIHHGNRTTPHGGNIMNIHQNGTVACPVGIRFQKSAPDAVCGKKQGGLTVPDHGSILTVGRDDIRILGLK